MRILTNVEVYVGTSFKKSEFQEVSPNTQCGSSFELKGYFVNIRLYDDALLCRYSDEKGYKNHFATKEKLGDIFDRKLIEKVRGKFNISPHKQLLQLMLIWRAAVRWFLSYFLVHAILRQSFQKLLNLSNTFHILTFPKSFISVSLSLLYPIVFFYHPEVINTSS